MKNQSTLKSINALVATLIIVFATQLIAEEVPLPEQNHIFYFRGGTGNGNLSPAETNEDRQTPLYLSILNRSLSRPSASASSSGTISVPMVFPLVAGDASAGVMTKEIECRYKNKLRLSTAGVNYNAGFLSAFGVLPDTSSSIVQNYSDISTTNYNPQVRDRFS